MRISLSAHLVFFQLSSQQYLVKSIVDYETSTYANFSRLIGKVIQNMVKYLLA
jgi:hypothetical protein